MSTQYTIMITDGNAAFGDTEHESRAEVARIMRVLAVQLDAGNVPPIIHDINGNRVGTFTIDTV